ncbi:Mis6-domain-containing protein [Phycomyces blakesleeanus]
MPQSDLRSNMRAKFKKLYRIISRYGVSDTHIGHIIDVIYSNKLVESDSIKLVKLLLPRESVREKYAIQIFGNLSCRKHTPNLMARLLKWVITIYDLLETREHIDQMYPVLFHYLTVETLRPQLCHILYYMTKRVHVKPYRIRTIIKLIGNIALEPHLYALLFVFKTYYPDIVMPSNHYHKKFIFAHPDPDSRELIQEIWTRWNTIEPGETIGLHKPTLENSLVKRRRRVGDNGIIPDIVTTRAKRDSTTIQEIYDVAEFAENVDRLELPDQLASVLDNRILQHVVICSPKATTIARISLWLSQNLHDLVKWNNHTEATKERFRQLLQKSLTMARFAKSLLPVMESFLRDYLKQWNGVEFEKEIFELISYVKPVSFEELYSFFLKPLYRLFCLSDVTWKTGLVLCYTNWLKNWSLLDWHGHVNRRQENSISETDVDKLIWLLDGLSLDVDYFAMLHEFVSHVDQISVLGLALEEDHPLLQHGALSFYEQVSTLSTQHNVPEIILPEEPFITRLFFSTSAMSVSRICGIIYQYKLAFESTEDSIGDWTPRHTPEYLEHFNMYVMDICNALWRNLAFSQADDSTRSFSLPTETIEACRALCAARGDRIDLAISVTHSVSLASFSKRFMETKKKTSLTECVCQMQEQEQDFPVHHQGPITADSLSALEEIGGLPVSFGEYRIQYLDYLAGQGLRGVHDLLYASMVSLINHRQALEQGGAQY